MAFRGFHYAILCPRLFMQLTVLGYRQHRVYED